MCQIKNIDEIGQEVPFVPTLEWFLYITLKKGNLVQKPFLVQKKK